MSFFWKLIKVTLNVKYVEDYKIYFLRIYRVFQNMQLTYKYGILLADTYLK